MSEVTTPNPAEVPATGDATAASPAPEFNQAAFEERLRRIDPQWNIQNFDELGVKMREAVSKHGMENKTLRDKWAKYEQLDAELSKDQSLRAHLDQAIRGYYADGEAPAPGYSPSARSPVAQAFDPNVQRLNSVETQLATIQINNDLSALEAKGFPMDDDRRDAVLRRVLETQWGNARDHYMALYGEEVIKVREAEAVRAATEAIQKNAGMYVQGAPKSTGVQSRVDVTKMSDAEFDQYSRERLKGISGPFRD